MTREEAIRIIETVFQDEYVYKYYDSITHQALNMAIEALQNLSKPNNGLQGSDFISRQDAIRWVKTECNPYGKPTLDFESGKKVIEHIRQMPSADRPTGHIVTKCNGEFRPTVWAECSECGKPIDPWDKFCRHCGAMMLGEDGEA